MVATAAASADPDQLRAADGRALWLEGGDGITLEQALGLPSTWRTRVAAAAAMSFILKSRERFSRI
jgi:hypothetical protein